MAGQDTVPNEELPTGGWAEEVDRVMRARWHFVYGEKQELFGYLLATAVFVKEGLRAGVSREHAVTDAAHMLAAGAWRLGQESTKERIEDLVKIAYRLVSLAEKELEAEEP